MEEKKKELKKKMGKESENDHGSEERGNIVQMDEEETRKILDHLGFRFDNIEIICPNFIKNIEYFEPIPHGTKNQGNLINQMNRKIFRLEKSIQTKYIILGILDDLKLKHEITLQEF